MSVSFLLIFTFPFFDGDLSLKTLLMESGFLSLVVSSLSARKDLSWLSCPVSELKTTEGHIWVARKVRRENSQASPLRILYLVEAAHLEVILKCWASTTLLATSFLQRFNRQQVQNLKITIQNIITSNMTIPHCMMVLNHDLRPECSQLNMSKDWTIRWDFLQPRCLLPNFVQLGFYFPRGVFPSTTGSVCYRREASLLSKQVIKGYRIVQTTLATESSGRFVVRKGYSCLVQSSWESCLCQTSPASIPGKLYFQITN